jgi:hypothetical protein
MSVAKKVGYRIPPAVGQLEWLKPHIGLHRARMNIGALFHPVVIRYSCLAYFPQSAFACFCWLARHLPLSPQYAVHRVVDVVIVKPFGLTQYAFPF